MNSAQTQFTPQAIGRKVLWRLALPTILFLLLSSLDRVNISFAALQMNSDLKLTHSQYGFGAGILFLGFLAGQFPSVILLQRLGMHRWMAGCSILLGCCAAGIAFVHTPLQFYTLRILLGIAEGGLAPGIVVYLSQFATERERATTFAIPMLAIPLSVVIGSPISGYLMSMRTPWGLAGWQWMLIAEALPAILLGILAWLYFPDRLHDVRWLSDDERQWLERNAANRVRSDNRNEWRILRQPIVLASALIWFCLLSGAYGIMFWLPLMIKQLSSVTPIQIGLINALPWAGAMLGMYYNSRHSDRTGERFYHIGVPAQGAFWALPTSALNANTFAVAAVAINIAGTSSGLIVPNLVGYVREQSGSFLGPTLLIALIVSLAALLVAYIRRFLFDRESKLDLTPVL